MVPVTRNMVPWRDAGSPGMHIPAEVLPAFEARRTEAKAAWAAVRRLTRKPTPRRSVNADDGDLHGRRVNHSVKEEALYQEIVAEDRWDYEAILVRARYEHVRIRTYLVSGPQGDPFYVGQPAQREAVAWLTVLWPRLGYGPGQRVHDRRMHYRIMSLGVTLLDGTPYDSEHGDKCWLYLQHACKWARYLKEIDFSQIEDRRNPAAMGYGWQEEEATEADVSVLGTYLTSPLEEVEFPEPPSYDIAGLTSQQRYHLEVWAEKTTMNDILRPWCERHHAWLVTASGEMTLSGAYDAVRRIGRDGRDAVLFYISDFDPPGQTMPVSLARKVEWLLREGYGENGFGEEAETPQVIVKPVALTFAQVQEYDLPDMPLGGKWGPKRTKEWTDRFHIGTVELDALEAVQPGTLSRLLDDAAAPFYDDTLNDQLEEARDDLAAQLDEARDEVLAEYQEQRDALATEWESAVDEARKLLEPIWDKIITLTQEVGAQLEERIEDIVAEVEVPEPEEADAEELDSALFNSERDYREQLEHYRTYKEQVVGDDGDNGDNGDDDEEE